MQFLKEETMKTLRIAGLLVFALTGFAIADEAKSAPKNIPDFDVQGISMTECQCTAYACPCRSNGHPDHGSCDAADFTYIKHGHYGKVDMSGFNAVLAFMFGWNPPHIVGSKVVAIDFKESPDKSTYTLTIPDILEEKGVMKRDSAGQPMHVVPAMDLWGNKITYLDNVVFKYHDKGVGEWDLSGHQANVKEFHTTKAMYDQKKLLMQHGDMSGTWTAEQKKMIEGMGMKAE